MATASASGRAAGSSTRRIPRPPPPATALTNTGNPTFLAAATSVPMSLDGSLDGSTGIPAAVAAMIACALLPASSRTEAPGPMKVMPASAQACARYGFSDRNP